MSVALAVAAAAAAPLASAAASAVAPLAAAAAPLAPQAGQAGLAGSLESYLVVSSTLFVLGVLTILTRRNLIYVLMGVELVLNAANINFVAFARFGGWGIDGQLFAMIVIVLAAAEAAIALAIVMRVFHDFGSVDVTRTDSLRD